jgi:hypothetical protein
MVNLRRQYPVASTVVNSLQHHQVGGITASSSSYKVNSNQTQNLNHVISRSMTRRISPLNIVQETNNLLGDLLATVHQQSMIITKQGEHLTFGNLVAHC